jgi:hypothetical protein
MKRVAEKLESGSSSDSKRPRLDASGVDSTAIFWDPTQEKTATDLRKWTPGDSGYVSGKICMKWPLIKGRLRIKMDIFSHVDGGNQFEAVFNGACAEELSQRKLQFKIGQELKLSLKGAVMEKASRATSLPVAKYTDGVALQILRKGEEPGITIDTWFRGFSAI